MIQHLKVERNLRYAISGNMKDPKILFIVLHGYGQLSNFFIRKFEWLDERFLIVAPEGPHRFYLNGTSGRVGASWMTKEDRDIDIADNHYFLDKLSKHVLGQFPSLCSINVLGFSQGAATAARWAEQTGITLNSLILWATVFPPDLQEAHFDSRLKLFFAIGNEDPYYPVEKAKTLCQEHALKGFNTFLFEGDHNLDKETLERIISQF